MKVAALLPMKAHSERVPSKNMRSFEGRPLYHYIAQILEDSLLVDQILIDTDSEVIANDARKYFDKVTIIDRPVNLRGNLVAMNDIIAHDINVTEAEHFLQTHSTNPLLTKKTLEQAILKYFGQLPEYDSLFSVTKIQSRLYWETGDPLNHDPQELLRTQDLPPLYEENSNLYLFSRTSFVAAGNSRVGLRPRMFVMSKIEAIDIDDEEDWQIAEALYDLRRKW